MSVMHSQSIKELATALARAQAEIEGANRDSANPFFKSKYADLASVWSACRAALTKNGIAVSQPPEADGAKVTVTTMLLHESGEWISSPLTMTAKEDSPQAVGSAITYARRYALAAMVGVAPEDDDGEGAMGREHKNGSADKPKRETIPPNKKRATDAMAALERCKTESEFLEIKEKVHQHYEGGRLDKDDAVNLGQLIDAALAQFKDLEGAFT